MHIHGASFFSYLVSRLAWYQQQYESTRSQHWLQLTGLENILFQWDQIGQTQIQDLVL